MRSYHIFISHSWTYSDAYEKLSSMLKSASYFDFKDFSVPKNDPIHNAPTSQQLYDAIKVKMAPTSIILVMSGIYSSYSEWIKKEMQIAKTEFPYPKKILAIEPWGSERTSTFVKDNADKVVGWNGQGIAAQLLD